MTMLRISDSCFLVCSRKGKAVLSRRPIEPNSAPSWDITPNSGRQLSFTATALMTASERAERGGCGVPRCDDEIRFRRPVLYHYGLAEICWEGT